MKSFRVRILVGSLVWTIAILASSHALFQIVVFRDMSQGHRIILALSLLAMGVGAMLVTSTLVPFRRLRNQLLELREGRRQAIAGTFPTEIQPLVDDLNGLLAQRERALLRAQAKAGDLAHGLKTPLAILSQEAERIEREGQTELSTTLSHQVERMRRQVEYHLAQARAGSGAEPGVRSSVKDTADAIIRTLKRLYRGRGLTFHLEISEIHAVRVRREDLEEILGNLLDNACKWGRESVTLSSAAQAGEIVIVVEDDGPGLDPALRDRVLQRGVRADESMPGSGLGLAIVHELVGLYGGSISLEDSPSHSLKVNVRLPIAGR